MLKGMHRLPRIKMQQSLVKNKPLLISVVHHPVERGNVTIAEVPFHHQSIQNLKKQFTGNQEVLAGLDGEQIMPDAWRITHVGPGSHIVFLPAAAGPVLGWVASTFFTWAFVSQLAIAFGVAYLGGMLFGPSMEQPRSPERGVESQSFGWAPITTQREGIPHPMCYGRNMHYGNIVARWTDVNKSGDEILYMILDYGRGPVQGKTGTVYFNDQPEGNFPSVTVQERLGTLNQTCMTGFEQNKLEYRPKNFKITNTDGSVTWTTPNNFFDDIEYTLEWPRGLWHYQDDGSRVEHGIGVKVEISERGLSAWSTLLETTINGNQLAPIYKAYKVSEQGFNCTHGKQYDLKYSKTSADKGADRYGDELVLRSVREVVDVAFTRPGKALLGITALATERLSGHINVKWVADDKLVRVYNGTSWGIAFSHNRAWVVLDELTQPCISGDGGANPWTIERYDGLDPSRIDLAFIYEWAEWCADQVTDGNGGTEDRMTCDIIVDWLTDVWSLAYELAQVGRMSPYWQGNILTGWVDKAVTDAPFALVTFDNIMVKRWKSVWAGFGELAGSVEVYYKDSLQGYERKPLPIPNEDAGLYTRIIAIEGTGVVGHALAARVGNHALTRAKLIKNINSVRMHKDALRYRLGKVVRLQSNVPNWGKSYRVIKSDASNTVELDRVVEAAVGDIIYVRSYDEANKKVDISSYTVASAVGKVVTIVETWDVTPIKNNIVAIGVAGAIKLRRIIKMRHTVDNYFDVELETYDTDLFASDNFDPNFTNPDYAWLAPASELTKPITKWEVVELISQMLPPQPDIDIPWLSNCDWTGSGGDTVSWAKRNADEPILFRYRGVSYQITPDSTTDEFIYWDPNFTTQFRTTNLAATAFAVGKWVMCRNKAGVAYPATPMQLAHAGILQAGTITAALGQIADATIGTAKIIDLAVQTIKVADNAITIPTTAYTSGSIAVGTSWVTVQTVTFTSTGNPVLVLGCYVPHFNIGGNTQVQCRIRRDTTTIWQTGAVGMTVYYDIDQIHSPHVSETPSAGSRTYIMQVLCTTAANFSVSQRSLTALEVKK